MANDGDPVRASWVLRRSVAGAVGWAGLRRGGVSSHRPPRVSPPPAVGSATIGPWNETSTVTMVVSDDLAAVEAALRSGRFVWGCGSSWHCGVMHRAGGSEAPLEATMAATGIELAARTAGPRGSTVPSNRSRAECLRVLAIVLAHDFEPELFRMHPTGSCNGPLSRPSARPQPRSPATRRPSGRVADNCCVHPRSARRGSLDLTRRTSTGSKLCSRILDEHPRRILIATEHVTVIPASNIAPPHMRLDGAGGGIPGPGRDQRPRWPSG